MENLIQYVKGKATSDKKLILVAGSSISLGVGQSNSSLWTDKLQEELGNTYAVVNVSFRSLRFSSLGLILLELFSSQYKTCYVVADTGPGSALKLLSEKEDYPYDYLAWSFLTEPFFPKNEARKSDAFKGLCSHFEAVRLESKEQFIRAILEKISNSSNFWNFIGEYYFFTAYSPINPAGLFFATRRKNIMDNGSPPSNDNLRLKQLKTNLDPEMKVLYSIARAENLNERLKEECKNIKNYFPNKNLRKKVLFLVAIRSPYYLDQLSIQDRTAYNLSISEWVKLLEQSDFHAIAFGKGYSHQEYADGAHFSNEGSSSMAKDVAREIKKMEYEK